MTMKKSILFILLSLSAAVLSACHIQKESTAGFISPETIADLVPSLKSDENVILITESGEYIPYTVLCSNYSGGVLICRQNLIDESIAYQSESIFGAGGSYYADSMIDQYLNHTFIKRYSPKLRSLMIDADIVITAKETITRGDYRRTTETIRRAVFLLSAEELGIKDGYLAREGNPIPWFETEQHRYSPSTQWLRSAYLWDDTHAWVLDGNYNYSENITKKHSCKPALVLPKNLAIEKMNDQGQTVYCLKNEK